MTALAAVNVGAAPLERFRPALGERYAEVEEGIAAVEEVLGSRVVWHVNSTAQGGGVAEMLQSLLAYARGAGADVRWVVISGDPDFFRITKRLHNNLHGAPGDDGPLGAAERSAYERTLEANATELGELVRPEDVVYLHDPQTAGLIPPLRAVGAKLVWRCHVGVDTPNELAHRAWDFLRPYVEQADAYVFSRRAYTWEGLDEERLWIVPPSIDAFSAKNQELDPTAVKAILGAIGVQEPVGGDHAAFTREDGTPGRVDRRAGCVQDDPVPSSAPLVAQVSRWDRLKDPLGVLHGFAEVRFERDTHLLLAGPATGGVTDDPEGAEVLDEVVAARAQLEPGLRARLHLASLPMEDREENAAMVNAIQRRADVVVQKSLAEGFGLTVAEAMWKGRPVVASRIGGIQDQIVNGESGVLLDDPRDLAEFGAATASLIHEPERAAAMGREARERVRERYLATRPLVDYLRLLAGLLG
jgi:trehalose synthase